MGYIITKITPEGDTIAVKDNGAFRSEVRLNGDNSKVLKSQYYDSEGETINFPPTNSRQTIEQARMDVNQPFLWEKQAQFLDSVGGKFKKKLTEFSNYITSLEFPFIKRTSSLNPSKQAMGGKVNYLKIFN